MADLGGGVPTSNGNGTRPRPAGAPVPTGSPGIRGPRVIMQERIAREEARRRAEQEAAALNQHRAEQEALEIEEAQRRNAERRAAAATAAGGAPATAAGETPQPGGPRVPGASSQSRLNPGATRPQAGTGPGATVPGPQQPQQSRTGRTQATGQPQPGPEAYGAQRQPGVAPPGESSTAGGGAQTRSSFPHAFQRWETLSAHWEGLTSFWIRRLEQNTEELKNNPVSQQLSRQVTDLSAAGANLFHAVVELQRLRASSERKFQRWFFETRAELERAQEVNAMLEGALDEERRGRADAIRDAVEHERANSKTQKQLIEMRKELQISKDEARRAWEELGRREQEERDRTNSLQSGQPTIVGGVQVVPMMQGSGRPGTAGRGGGSAYYQDEAYGSQQGGYGQEPAVPSPTPGGGFYQQGQTALHQGASSGGGGVGGAYSAPPGSEGGYSEGEYAIDAQGNFIRDAHGNKVPFRGAAASPGTESDLGAEDDLSTGGSQHHYRDYAAAAAQAAAQQRQLQQGSNPSSPATSGLDPQYRGAPPAPSAYAVPGWEQMPRHHHPTRLSDVMEEDDERSRTSASHVSRG